MHACKCFRGPDRLQNIEDSESKIRMKLKRKTQAMTQKEYKQLHPLQLKLF